MLCGTAERCTAPGSALRPLLTLSLYPGLSPSAAALLWLTDISGDPHGSSGAALTLQEPVDEAAWEWGILQRTRRR